MYLHKDKRLGEKKELCDGSKDNMPRKSITFRWFYGDTGTPMGTQVRFHLI